MKAGNTPLYVFYEINEGFDDRGPAGDDHIIETGLSGARQCVTHGSTKPPADAIPLDGVAVLLCNGKADARRSLVRAIMCLDQQGACIRAQTRGRSQEILALEKPLHGKPLHERRRS